MTKLAELMSSHWEDYVVIFENYLTYLGAGIAWILE